MPNGQAQATAPDELSRYEAAAPDELSRYAAAEKPAPKTDQGTIGPTARLTAAGFRSEPHPLETIENYTQEGRKAHPILSRIGDATRNAKDMLRVIGPELGLLSGAPGGMNSPIGEVGEIAPQRLSSARAPAELKPIEYKPSEKAETMSAPAKSLGPEFEAGQISHEIDRYKGIVRNPLATAEERSIATSRLDELQSHAGGGRLQPVGPKARTLTIDEIANQLAGVKPLKPDVPLREQLPSRQTPGVEEVDPMKVKYPDPAVRQMVRANGERIVKAVGDKPELMKQIHDLTRVDLRQALINAGEDMGQKTVSNSKFAGEGSIGRQDAFDRLLAKGHTPEQILELAKQQPAGPKLVEVERYSEPGKEQGNFYAPKGEATQEFGSVKSTALVDESKLFKGKSSLEFLEKEGKLGDPIPERLKQEVAEEVARARESFPRDTANLPEPKTLKDLMEWEGLISGTPFYDALQSTAAKYLEPKGFKGAFWSEEDDLNPRQYQLWDRSAIQQPKPSKPELKIETIDVPPPNRLAAQRETRDRASRIRAARINP